MVGIEADVICLQELRPTTLPRWRETLVDAGYGSVEQAWLDPTDGRTRPLHVLTACRAPAVTRVAVADVPWSERVLAVRRADGLEIVNLHSPISPKPDLVKVVGRLGLGEPPVSLAPGAAP